jgi:ferredoxin
MREQLAKAIRETLENGKASAVLFLVEEGETLLPHVAKDAGDPRIDRAYAGDTRFPMAGFAAISLPAAGGTLAVVARECDRRMMNELAKFNHLDLEKLLVLGIPCSQGLADACMCDHPAPAGAVVESDVKPVESVEGVAVVEDEEGGEEPGGLDYWMGHFERCIRCYGCRNVCPLCFCKECAMERVNLAGTDMYPPDIPIFHIIRALDMADRCIDCGMCELSCPADIPLRSLYRQMCGLFTESFGYQPGLSAEEKSPLTFLGEPADFGAHE